jgi:hypothetical protein
MTTELVSSKSIALLLAAGSLVSLPAGAATPSDQAPRLLCQTTYAHVIGRPRAEHLASRVAAAVDQATPSIAPLVGAQDLRPLRAYVYSDRDSFRQAAHLPRRSTIVGIATFPEEVIHIDGTGMLASIEKIVPHEVGHVLLARALGPALRALPRWTNEGIAEYVAGERASQVDPVALRAIGRGSALDIAELDAAIRSGGPRTTLAYAQSASLVNFLVAERGEKVIADLLRTLRATHTFDTALEQTTGLPLPELESAWRTSLAHRWRWPLLFQSGAPFFVLMLLLFLVGLLRHFLRRHRRQEMPDQDW